MSEMIKPGQRLIPVLAMRGIVMFEGSLAHFDVGREKSLLALDYAMQHGRRILLVTQRDIMTENPTTDQLYQYGVLAEIKQMFKTQDGISRVLVECLQRIKLGKKPGGRALFAGQLPLRPHSPQRSGAGANGGRHPAGEVPV